MENVIEGAVDRVDEALALVGSVWAFRPGGHAAPPEALAGALGVVVARHVFLGGVDCVLQRLDGRAARSGRASELLDGCAYLGLAERLPEPEPEHVNAALAAAALEFARARCAARR